MLLMQPQTAPGLFDDLESIYRTEWSDPLGGGPPDLPRHCAFLTYAMQVLEEQSPGLLWLLEQIADLVLLGPYTVSFRLRGDRQWIDLDQMAAHLHLRPTAESYENMH